MWRLPNPRTYHNPSVIHFGSSIKNVGLSKNKIPHNNTSSTTFKNNTHKISFVNKNTYPGLLSRTFTKSKALPPPTEGSSKRTNFKLNFKFPNFNFKMPDFKKVFNQDSMLWKLKGVLLGLTGTGLVVYYAGGIILFLSKFMVVGVVGLLGIVAVSKLLARNKAALLLARSYHLLALNKDRIEKEVGAPFEVPTEIDDFEMKRKRAERMHPITGTPDAIIVLSCALQGENGYGNLLITGSKDNLWEPTEISLEMFSMDGKKKIPLYDKPITYDILEVKKGKAKFIERSSKAKTEEDMLEQILDSKPAKSATELIQNEFVRNKRLKKKQEEGMDILLSMDDDIEEVLEELPPHVKEYYRKQEEEEKMKKLAEEIQKKKDTTKRKLY